MKMKSTCKHQCLGSEHVADMCMHSSTVLSVQQMPVPEAESLHSDRALMFSNPRILPHKRRRL